MRKKFAKAMIITGIVCVFASLSLFAYNRAVSFRAARFADDTVAELRRIASEEDTGSGIGSLSESKNEKTAGSTDDTDAFDKDGFPDEAGAGAQSVTDIVIIKNYEFIGYLSIPSLQLELPVMMQWSYENLSVSPCRYSGSPLTDDLVIAAHNYSSHFGFISNLHVGDTVSFTDVHGIKTDYRVELIDTLSPTDVEDMAAGDYALTLFTCTYTGQARVTVRLNRA